MLFRCCAASALGSIQSRRWLAAWTPEAAARAVPRRGTQQAAVGLFDSARADRRISQPNSARAWPWWARSATIFCSSSIPSSSSFRATASRICSCSSATTSIYMDRKKEQIERYRYDFALRRSSPPRTALARGSVQRAGRAQAARPGSSSDHTPARVHGQRRNRARRHARRANTTKSCCARPSRRPTPEARRNCSSAFRKPAPAPTNFSCSSATSN